MCHDTSIFFTDHISAIKQKITWMTRETFHQASQIFLYHAVVNPIWAQVLINTVVPAIYVIIMLSNEAYLLNIRFQYRVLGESTTSHSSSESLQQ